jgi:hypothetical protein
MTDISGEQQALIFQHAGLSPKSSKSFGSSSRTVSSFLSRLSLLRVNFANFFALSLSLSVRRLGPLGGVAGSALTVFLCLTLLGGGLALVILGFNGVTVTVTVTTTVTIVVTEVVVIGTTELGLRLVTVVIAVFNAASWSIARLSTISMCNCHDETTVFVSLITVR